MRHNQIIVILVATCVQRPQTPLSSLSIVSLLGEAVSEIFKLKIMNERRQTALTLLPCQIINMKEIQEKKKKTLSCWFQRRRVWGLSETFP